MKNISWEIRDTLIVVVLAAVGIAISLGVAGYRAGGDFNVWLQYRTDEAITWAIIGLVAGAGLGVAMQLNSK